MSEYIDKLINSPYTKFTVAKATAKGEMHNERTAVCIILSTIFGGVMGIEDNGLQEHDQESETGLR